MIDDLNRHLDGEIPLEGLEERDQREAEAWERLLSAFRSEASGSGAPPWLETRVMAEIEALPEPGLLKRMGSWLWSPQPVRVSPLMVGTVAAALTALLFVGGPGQNPGSLETRPGQTVPAAGAFAGQGDEPVIFVQFLLSAPEASSVVVAGDFDGWEGSHALQDPDGDGLWTGRVPVRPGVHAYMFLVDGSTWVTDPEAERYADDGFGNRNAVLAVSVPTV